MVVRLTRLIVKMLTIAAMCVHTVGFVQHTLNYSMSRTHMHASAQGYEYGQDVDDAPFSDASDEDVDEEDDYEEAQREFSTPAASLLGDHEDTMLGA